MRLVYKCYDCNKTLILGIQSFYEHPTEDGKYLCQSCDTKYMGLRNALYLKTLDKVHNNLMESFNSYLSESEEEPDKYPEKLDANEATELMKKFKQMYEDGGLSKEEYEKARDKVLRSV